MRHFAYFLKDVKDIGICCRKACCKKLSNVSSWQSISAACGAPFAGFLGPLKPYPVVLSAIVSAESLVVV